MCILLAVPQAQSAAQANGTIFLSPDCAFCSGESCAACIVLNRLNSTGVNPDKYWSLTNNTIPKSYRDGEHEKHDPKHKNERENE